MNIHSPSLSERERSLIKLRAKKELSHAQSLMAQAKVRPDDPDRYRDIAAALRKVADRYDSLAEDTP